jgi:membrane-associated phospholipid phosphatase
MVIGYSRILEGDHWLTDVLGGYWEGCLHLFLFIFLYHWLTRYIALRLAQKKAASIR